LTVGRAIHVGVALVVLLIAVDAVADMVAPNPAEIAGADAPIVPEAAAGAGTCRWDQPYFDIGCAVRPGPTEPASVARPVRVITIDRAAPEIRANQVEATRLANTTMSTTMSTTPATDGSGRHQLAEGAPPARVAAPLAVAIKSSESVLTFKQGYAVRQAARTVAAMPAQSTPKSATAAKQRKAASMKTKPRQERTTARVYGFPDGPRGVVQRPYGDETAPVDAHRETGRFRSAGFGPDRFGRRIDSGI
jgi:hypothetical protein